MNSRKEKVPCMAAGEAAFDGQPGPPSLARLEITGPYNVTGVSETPGERRISVCRPSDAADETACASRILSTAVRRAFRRDIAASDIRPYLATYTDARKKQGFQESITAAIRDVLLAPDFLFRIEFDRGVKPGSAQPVSDFELASRLSFFPWSSVPDDSLLEVAGKGKLRSPGVLESMLDDALAVAGRLLAAGADPNLLRKDGHTPFSVAVLAGDAAVVKEMIARGANLEMRYDPDDKIPDPVEAITLSRNQSIMHLAALSGSVPVVEYLCSRNAPLDLKNDKGEIPLALAGSQERYREAAQRQNADGDPERLKKIVRHTEMTDAIRKLLAALDARSRGPIK